VQTTQPPSCGRMPPSRPMWHVTCSNVMPFIILLSLPAVTVFSKRPSRVPNGGRQPQIP
jgi:hypothetical protein